MPATKYLTKIHAHIIGKMEKNCDTALKSKASGVDLSEINQTGLCSSCGWWVVS